MKRVILYLLIASAGIASTSCKKDTVAATPAPTKTELLTNKNWVLTAETVSPGINVGGGTVITDLYGQMQACSKDDFIRFETPNVYKEDEGATKCSSSSPQTTTGTWVFNADQTIITTTSQGSTPQSLNIVELTGTSLKVTATEALNGVNYTITATFRKS